MAITVTTILGTDSLTASRPIINDNFNILKDEINAIEAYIDPDAGTISGLTSIQSVSELRVGPSGNYYLELTPSSFNISRGITFTSPSAVTEMAGLFAHNSFSQLSSILTGISTTITPTSGSRYYYIVHNAGGTYTVALNAGYFGQEVTLSCEQIASGTIDIVASGSTSFVFGPTTYPTGKATISEIGGNITLTYILDSSGNGAWYATSYHNATLS